MGIGIWAMHFIGMLAFSLPIRLSYGIALTVLSLLLAIASSGFALFLVSRPRIAWRNLIAGGTLLGLGISSMHYTGMYALRMQPAIEYDLPLLLASVLMAIGASTVGLGMAFVLHREKAGLGQIKKIGSAVVLGLAIIAMHYTGMAAANFRAGSVCGAAGGIDGGGLAAVTGIVTVCILGVTLLLALVDAHQAARTAGLVRSLKHANERLNFLALHDNLTGLPNRILLEDRVAHAIAAANRSGRRFALLFIDLDRFKLINDSLGHRYGDKLLKAVAEQLKGAIRAEDTAARLSGDEFVLLLEDIPKPQKAAEFAAKILAILAQPLVVEEQRQNISCSIGISIYPDDGSDFNTLIVRADSAMYHAKKTGRVNYQFFTTEMNAATLARLEQERDLRQAMQNGEFELHYQPKVDIRSGKIVAVEALLRWRHLKKGLIPPASFIPLAEEIGLILPLGAWVLQAACRQTRQWRLQGFPPLRMAVNLSSVQLRQENLVAFISDVLDECGLDASCLELEVTESMVMENAEETIAILEQLHVQGIHISIDDFGTGYSSLSYLKRFPIDALKIDRSFVRDISTDMNDAVIVESVIALAHSLKLSVIAEGVETREQLDFLRRLGCDEYQGYYCSRPLPAEQCGRWLHQAENTGCNQKDANQPSAVLDPPV